MVGKEVTSKIMKVEDMYDAYADNIYHYLLTTLKSRQDAEDILQEVFLKLSNSEGKLQKVDNIKNYIFITARNEAIDFIRKRKTGSSVTLSGFLEPVSESDAGAVEAKELEKQILELPLEQRETVFLKIYMGFTFDEIAKMAKESINTISSRYRYGIENLKKKLKPGDL